MKFVILKINATNLIYKFSMVLTLVFFCSCETTKIEKKLEITKSPNIIFINVLEDQEIILGKSKTDKEGIAQLTIPENHVYLTDKEGYINLKAVFEGKGELDSEEDEIAIKDLFLDLNLSEIDSVKTVSLKAFTLDSLHSKGSPALKSN